MVTVSLTGLDMAVPLGIAGFPPAIGFRAEGTFQTPVVLRGETSQFPGVNEVTLCSWTNTALTRPHRPQEPHRVPHG